MTMNKLHITVCHVHCSIISINNVINHTNLVKYSFLNTFWNDVHAPQLSLLRSIYTINVIIIINNVQLATAVCYAIIDRN